MKQAGATVTLSSDFPVSPLNPFEGMANAVTHGWQKLCLKDVIEMYTVNAAYSMRQEHRTGYLGAGMDADFIVIDRDVMYLAATWRIKKIRETQVMMTVLEGEEICHK